MLPRFHQPKQKQPRPPKQSTADAQLEILSRLLELQQLSLQATATTNNTLQKLIETVERTQERSEGHWGRLLKMQAKGIKIGSEIVGSLQEKEGKKEEVAEEEEERKSIVSQKNHTEPKLGVSQQFQLTMVPVAILVQHTPPVPTAPTQPQPLPETPAPPAPSAPQPSPDVSQQSSTNPSASYGQFLDKELIVKVNNYFSSAQLPIDELKAPLNRWLAHCIDLITKESFHGYSSSQLTEMQAKVFFGRNLLLNYHELVSYFPEDVWEKHSIEIMKAYEAGLKNVLDYQLTNYPQKKKIFVSDELKGLLPVIDRSKQGRFSIMANCKRLLEFKGEEIADYFSSIKKFLNSIVLEAREHFPAFTKTMSELFTVAGENKELYQLEHLIGTKFREDTPIYSEAEIEESGLDIKTPEMLRVVVKWVEELEEAIKSPLKWLDRQYINTAGQAIEVPQRLITKLCQSLAHDQYFKSAGENNFKAINRILGQLHSYASAHSKYFPYLTSSACMTGMSVFALSQVIGDTLGRYLNSLISLIKLQFYMSVDELKNHKIEFHQEFEIVNFGVSDLLRAKCFGKLNQMQKVIAKMKEMEERGDIEIARIKNRLDTGNRDFLVNFKLRGCAVLCEVQIGLKAGKADNKAVLLDHYNHFIYELYRSRYGPLAESAIIVSNGTDIATFFEKRLAKVARVPNLTSPLSLIIRENRLAEIGFKNPQQTNGFICCNCQYLFRRPIAAPQIDEKTSRLLCRQCIFEGKTDIDKTNMMLRHPLNEYFEYKTLEETKKTQPLFIVAVEEWIRPKLLTNRYMNQYYETMILQKKDKMFYSDLGKFKDTYFFTMKKECICVIIDKEKVKQKRKFKDITLKTCGVNIRMDLDQSITNKKLTWMPFDSEKGIQSGQAYCLFVPSQSNLVEIDNVVPEATIKQLYKMSRMEALFKEHSQKKSWNLEKRELTPQIFQKFSPQNNVVVELFLSYNTGFKDVTFLKSNSLKVLQMTQCGLEAIKGLEGFPKMERIQVEYNRIKSLQGLQHCPKAIQIMASQNLIQEISIQGLHQLTFLKLSHNKLNKFITNKGCWPLLKNLELDENQLQELNFQEAEFPSLLYFNISKNKLRSLLLPTLPNLTNLDIQKNPLTSLSLLTTPAIHKINANNCSLSTITFGPSYLELGSITLSGNCLEELDLTDVNLPKLASLVLSRNRLKRLELSNNMPKITQLDVSKNRLRRFALKGKANNLGRLIVRANYLTTIQFSEDFDPKRLDYIGFDTNLLLFPKSNIPIPFKKIGNSKKKIMIYTYRGRWEFGFLRWILQSYSQQQIDEFCKWTDEQTQLKKISPETVMAVYNSMADNSGQEINSRDEYQFCQLFKAYTGYKLPIVFEKRIDRVLKEDMSNAEEDIFNYGEEENTDMTQYMGWAK